MNAILLDQVRGEIRAFIAERYFRDDEDLSILRDNASLVTTSIIDSLDKQELVVHVMRNYQIDIDPYEQATELDSINSIAQLVVRKQTAASGAPFRRAA